MLPNFRLSVKLILIAAVGLLSACMPVTGYAAATGNPQDGRLHGTALQTHIPGPPITTASLSGTAGNNGWYLSTVTVTLTATANNGPSVKSTFYSIDGGATETYSAPFSVTGDGTHTLTFYSTPFFGPQETLESITIKIDTTGPSLTYGTQSPLPNGNGWNNTPVTIPYTVSDAISGIASSSPSSPLIVSTSGDQGTTVTVTNNAGNIATYYENVNVDLTPPVTKISTANAGSAYEIYIDVVSSKSGVDTVTYSLDGGAPQTIPGGYPYEPIGPIKVTALGPHTFTYSCTDYAGNVEAEQTFTFTVGTFLPTTTAVAYGNVSPITSNGTWYSGPVTETLTAQAGSFPVAATYYTLDGGPQTAYTTPVVITGDGSHTFTYYSVDTLGNAETPNSTSLQIDTTPPTTTASIVDINGNTGPYFAGSATVTLSATDSLSGVYETQYQLDGGPRQVYTGPFTVSKLGDNELICFSTDNAGNNDAEQYLVVPVVPALLNTFATGLQLIAVPEDYSSFSLSYLISETNPILAVWSPLTDRYLYTPDSPADALRPGYGYWVDLTQSVELLGEGVATPTNVPFTISLSAGWNMIGDPFPGNISLNNISVVSGENTYRGLNAAATANVIALPLYSYDSSSTDYVTDTTSLAPYVGYWIYAYSNCTLDISSP